MVKSSASTTAAPLTRIKRRQLSQLVKGKGKKRCIAKESQLGKGNKGHKDRSTTNIKITTPELECVMSGNMLNDGLIDAASCSKMLRKQFPDVWGLQSPLLGESLSFQVTEPPFVQILHVGGNHWMTIVVVDNTLVKVYDSLYRSVGTCVASQTVSIIKSDSDYLLFQIETTQIQQGGADCGLFAIVYATEFCFGNNPECYRY